MSSWIGRTSVAAVLLVGAIALAGCGGSKSTSSAAANSGNSGNSGTSSTAANSGNSGSSTSGNSGNSGTSTSGNSGNTGNSGAGAAAVTDSTPVSDPAYLANMASRVEKSGVPQAKAQAVAQCIVKKFEAQGLKTSGDVNAAGQTAFENNAYNPCASANGVQ